MWSCCIALRISFLVNCLVQLANFAEHFDGSLCGSLTLLIHLSQIRKSFISDGCLLSSLAGNNNDFFITSILLVTRCHVMPAHLGS